MSIKDLLDLYKLQPGTVQEEYASAFTSRRSQLSQPVSSLPKPTTNGQHPNITTGK